MILIKGRDWNTLQSLVTANEYEQLKKAVFTESMRPRRIVVEESLLSLELQIKLKYHLNKKT